MSWGLQEASAPREPWLRAVPDLAAPVGEGVLPDEAELDQPMVVRAVVPVTHDVVSVVLAPTRPGGVAFSPGQYVVLGADVGGERVERCYTIASPPTRPHLLTLTVKRTPGGVLSPWLHDSLRPGAVVHVRGPLGEFSVARHPARRLLLLSAGSGITPTLSTLRTLADLADLDSTDVEVVHCARTPADLACRAELDALAAAYDGLRVHWVVEHDPAGEWDGLTGRMTTDLLAGLVADAAEREVFTCGPPAYMDAARAALMTVGADPARCHEESFVLGTPGAPADDVADIGDSVEGEVRVRFARSGVDVRVSSTMTVLAAATAAGLMLPSSCEAGMCGTCKVGLLSGSVDMRHQGGIRPREVAQQKFLPCCSTPRGDVVVDA